VERIFVNAAIKKALCRQANGDRAWLNKVRPMYGHDYHFHIRIKCPDDSAGCKPQDPVPAGDGCGDLQGWFKDSVIHPKETEPAEPRKGPTLAQLPAACRGVVTAP
jgi:penicillin-insensitive murein endopeptidase